MPRRRRVRSGENVSNGFLGDLPDSRTSIEGETEESGEGGGVRCGGESEGRGGEEDLLEEVDEGSKGGS